MTAGAIPWRAGAFELAAVNVLVAAGAARRRIVESDDLRALRGHRPMAFQASDGAMRTQEFEFRFRVIERRRFMPGSDVVACLAVLRLFSRGIAVVRILVTGDAGERREMVGLARYGFTGRIRLVAVPTRRRRMAAR